MKEEIWPSTYSDHCQAVENKEKNHPFYKKPFKDQALANSINSMFYASKNTKDFINRLNDFFDLTKDNRPPSEKIKKSFDDLHRVLKTEEKNMKGNK